jgi:hypothetical protein
VPGIREAIEDDRGARVSSPDAETPRPDQQYDRRTTSSPADGGTHPTLAMEERPRDEISEKGAGGFVRIPEEDGRTRAQRTSRRWTSERLARTLLLLPGA